MFDVKITIGTTAELGAALNRLADALSGQYAPTPAPVLAIDGQTVGQIVAAAYEPAAPAPTPAPVPAVPVAQTAPTYTKEQIASAGAMYMQQDPANRDKLQTLLAQFGAPYINALPDEQLGAFATALRQLGANI